MPRRSKRTLKSEEDDNQQPPPQEEEQQQQELQEVEEKEQNKTKKRRMPTTLKEKIIEIVQNSETLVSLYKIKKILTSDYGYTGDKAFNTNVNKTLKALVDENDENQFGKVEGSYHGGITSVAYLNYLEKQRKASEIQNHIDEGDILCPYCDKWCSSECCLGEDSVARGGRFQCEHCAEEFWSWISDGYVYGHKVEYRYGDGRDDYADLNREEGKRDY